MDKEIISLITEIQDIETSLKEQIPLFQNKINFFLHSENIFKDQILLNLHQTLIKLNINNKQIEKLKYFSFVFNALINDIENEISQKHLIKIIEKINLNPQTNSELIKTFSLLRQTLHKYFFFINQYFIDSYAIKLIPMTNIQNIITENIYDFDFNNSDVELLIKTKYLKTNGELDKNKINQIEQEYYYFAKEISINSLLLKVIPIFQKEFEYNIFDEFFQAILENSLSMKYKEIFEFYYTQIYKNKIDPKQVIKNAQEKFKSFRNDLVIQINTDFLKNKNIIPKKIFEKNKNKLKIIINFMNSMNTKYLFDFSAPLIYKIKFQDSNKFEKFIYNAKISMEIYLFDILHNQNFLSSKAIIINSYDNYELISNMLNLKYYEDIIKNIKKYQIRISKNQYTSIKKHINK